MSGSRVLIVGASSGIGFESAARFHEDGCEVIAACRGEGRLSELEGVRHIAFDALNDPLPQEVVDEPLDGLVYCPGTITLKPFRALSEDDFLDDFRINVLGAVRVVKGALPALKRSKCASVVMFSTVAVQTGMSYHASIASAKGGVEGLVRSLAAELAPAVRVNAIAPSLTDTPLASRLLGSDQKRHHAEARHPLGRIGSPGDQAAAVHFLISERSSWITGQVLHVDGGFSTLRMIG